MDSETFVREASVAFEEWFSGLSRKQKKYLNSKGIKDFHGHLTMVNGHHEAAHFEAESDVLTAMAAGVMFPRGKRDFEEEFLRHIEPDVDEANGSYSADWHEAIAIVIDQVLNTPNVGACVLGLSILTRWDELEGFDAWQRARKLKIANESIKNELRAWKRSFRGLKLSDDVLAVLRTIVNELTTSGNVRTSIMSMAFVVGWGRRVNGLTAMKMAQMLGCSRQNFSKSVVRWRSILGITHYIGFGKSPEQRRSFQKAQLENHWRRAHIRAAAQIDSALKQ